MSKRRRVYDDIKESLADAIAYAKGEAHPSTYKIYIPDEVDVKSIRKKTGLTQTEFAAQFGFSVSAVRDWEQKRAQPEGPSRAYLRVIERRPDAVKDALRAA